MRLYQHDELSASTVIDNINDERNENKYLSAEAARIFSVLGDFHLLNHFTEGGTITGTIFPGDSNLLGAFGLKIANREKPM